MDDALYRRLVLATLVATVLVMAVFGTVPRLDLAISGAMRDGQGQFWAAEGAGIPLLNMLIRRSCEAVAVSICLLALLAVILRVRLQSGLRNWLFVAGTVLLGPGVIVNLLFKDFVGRARPETVIEFGGTARFSPMMQLSDQCASNCSFSSGEVALSAALMFCLLALTFGRLCRARFRWLFTVALAFVLLVMALRVGLGRHFASDAASSVLVSAASALLFYRLCGVGQSRGQISAAALRADFAQLWQRLCAGRARLWARLEPARWMR
jgi:lipid A 4'-phosphatase